MKKRRGGDVVKFFRGFVYAFRGLCRCVREERNFRFHIGAALHLFVYMPFFHVTRGEAGVLVILCALVLSLEAVNSAVERAVDVTGVVSPTAGAAKDMAAGAVLLAALAAVAGGVVILWRPAAFAAMAMFFVRHPLALCAEAVCLVVWLRWVFRKDTGRRTRS